MANNAFAYVEKMLPKVVDKVFACDSFTDALIGGSEIKLDFLDAKTVKIFRLASTGLTTYARGGHGSTNARGNAQSTTETFTLTQERYSEIPLDKLDTIDDGETVLAHLATEFIRTKVVPEFDTYRFAKLASFTSATFGNRKVGAISANTIISEFNAAFKWLAEQKVPEGNQIIYVNPTVMELIRNTTELYKKLGQSEYKGNVSFAIETYENRQIVVVPSDTFYTDAVTGDGYYPSADSKVINFLIVDKKAPIIIKNLDHAKVYNSTDQNGAYLGFVGYLLTNLYYHDLFVPFNKRVGIYASVSATAAAALGAGLLVEAVAAATATKTKILSVLTQPAGILYDKVYFAKEVVTLGTLVSALSSPTELTLGTTEVVPHGTNNVIVAARGGVVVAVSKNFGATGLPVGA